MVPLHIEIENELTSMIGVRCQLVICRVSKGVFQNCLQW